MLDVPPHKILITQYSYMNEYTTTNVGKYLPIFVVYKMSLNEK